MPHATSRQMSGDMQQCIQECLSCHSICLATVPYCLQMGGQHAQPRHVGLLLDCAEICQTSANFMLRGSELHMRTCGVCAELCDQCAQDCERMGDDAQMKACADACRRCADSCRRMATMAAYTGGKRPKHCWPPRSCRASAVVA